MRIPKPVVGVAVAVGVLGMGVASAELLPPLAAPDGPRITDPTTTEPPASTTTVVTTDPSPLVIVPAPAEGDDGHVARSYEGCGDFKQGTHGDYVSKVAHDPASTPAQRRAAAHSSCGKPVPSVEPGSRGDGKPDADEAPEAPEAGDDQGPDDAQGGGAHHGG